MKSQAKTDWSDLTALDGRSGQAALEILEEMAAAEGEQVFIGLGQLAPMVMQEGTTCPLSVRVFCALYELSFQKTLNDLLLILSFMGELRTLLLGQALYDTLPEEEYYQYYDTLWRLESAAGQLLAPEQLKEMTQADKSAFAMLYVSLLCPTPDSAAFLFNRPFEQAFHVRCPHCGNDLHSLYVGLDEANRDKDIVEAALPETVGERLPEDTYPWLTEYLQAMEETYYATILPRLYGEHTCGQCGQSYGVMEGMVGYITHNIMDMPLPKAEEITRNLEFAKGIMLEGEYDPAYFYFRLAREQQKRVSGEHSLEVARIDLQMTPVYQFRHDYTGQRLTARRALDTLEQLGGQPLDLAEAYRRLAYAWHADFENEENNLPELALEYYEQALAIYQAELGEGSEEVRMVRQNMARLLAEQQQDAQKSLELMEKNLQQQTDPEQIAEIHKNMSEVYADTLGDFAQAISHFQVYLDHACAVYGAESDFAADCYRDLAELYWQDGQKEAAAQYYERALEINIRELGRQYLLPDLFKSMLTGVLKAVGQERDPDDLMVRSMSAAESFDDLGMLYQDEGQSKKALKAFEKALALRQWVFDMPIKEIGDSYKNIAEVWEELDDTEKARQYYEQAAEIYAATIEADEKDGRAIFLSEAEECREALIEIAEILEDL